ncbi:leucyl/phenylalanyl-tRNA--protein transferase [Loktanella sp. 3ANDIMAR09]|uniref:leucyl/phenylalanyl-tRNA--protein transferase n=1 Tax=Loktanella sp. 3ANDIMAR09 TaxID=1225657 RepID=UPI0006FF0AEB|nr:leucyl/phenylalanyl-tRNA--protein transferase [Loktanella sp. 3ANDIMAR09]KQI69502.1 leucyl/phenylalanyl-tRNA--protein transferase [Loktanella sp. 3ANDIMAR09]
MTDHLTPDLLLHAYRAGVFPMAEDRDATDVFWVQPRKRGVLPLDLFHVSRSLRKTLRRGHFQVTADAAFVDVVRGCADRAETWINGPIFEVYRQLHLQGHAHSIEVWQDRDLVGGVYGVSIGGAFFGESMFSTRTDASKVALLCAVDRLRSRGFILFDTQFVTDHLATLGAIEIPRKAYEERLAAALEIAADFGAPGPIPLDQAAVQRMTQTS